MKKFSLMLVLAVMMTSSAVFAGSIDYLVNQSAKFLMTFSRNAATDQSADIANYNPAATATFAPGLYLDFSNQFLFKPYEQEYTMGGVTRTVEQSEPTLLLPNFYAVYNFGQVGIGNMAAYLHVGIPAGGGSLKWDDGTVGLHALAAGKGVTTDTRSLEVSSVYYGINVGVSYASPDNTVAASFGGRVLMPKRSIKADVTIPGAGAQGVEIEYDAVGWAPIIGFDVRPMKELTIAVRYEFETELGFENSVSTSGAMGPTFAGFLPPYMQEDAPEYNQNMPAMLAVGAEYKVDPQLTVLVSLNRYYLSQAYDETGNFGDDNFRTGWEASIGATYQVMSELKAGIGFIYTDIGTEDSYYENQGTLLTASGALPLNSCSIGLGATYAVMPTLDVTLAGSWTHYLPKSFTIGSGPAAIKGEYKKEVYNIGLGVGYKM